MFRNWTRKTAKWYLALSNLFFIGALFLSLILVFGLAEKGVVTTDLSVIQKLLLSVVCAIVPTASFCGFCTMFIKIDKLEKRQIMLMIVFCIPLVAFAVVFGAIMLIPTGINGIKIIKNT